MDRDRWNLVEDLFHRALERPESEWATFLETQTDDPAVVEDVMLLLRSDAADSPLLDLPLAEVAQGILGEREPPGRELGPYVLRHVLGEGGMGVVYYATRRDLGNPVAIKILRDAWVSPARRERFAAEQRTLSRLVHPGIARLLDAATLEDGTPYFVMEYVDGVPLTDYCAAHRSSVTERLRLFRGVCEAVRHAHARAIVHRDLKPSNILVDAGGTPRLLDFGIAKHLDDVEGLTTAVGFRPMTPAYAAPEQIRGEPVGVYTDVYSLGVILYELLTGRLPFPPSHAERARAVSDGNGGTPEAPSVAARHHPAGLPPAGWADLDVLCLTALQEDPARRYTSAEALIRDLDHYLAGEPLDARPVTLGYRVGKFVRRNRAVVSAAAVGVLALGIVSGGAALRLAEERNRAQLEAAKARQVSEYLIGLFEAGDPYSAEPEVLDVPMLLARGERRADELAAEPLLQAQMLDVLGRVRVSLGEYGEAETLLRRALDLRRADATDPLGVAETLTNLGTLFFYTGELEEAERALSEALQIRERLLPADHADIATSANDLGVILANRGDYGGAGLLYERALEIRRKLYPEPHEDVGSSLANLATNRFDRGDFAGARRYYEEALEIERAVYGPDHPSVATTLANLGKLHEQLENFAEAESLLTEALRIRQTRLGDEHYETALSHSQLGGLLELLGDYERAEAHLREALRIREATLGPDHPSVATTWNGLGLLLQRRGDLPAAEMIFRRVVDIYAAALGPEHRFTGVALCNLGSALHVQGRREEAETTYRRCVGILRAVHPPDHPELAFNLARLGAFLLEQGRTEEAEPLLQAGHDALLAAHGPEHERTREAAARLREARARSAGNPSERTPP